MTNFSDLNVYLYTGYTPRANALKERVEKACHELKTIQLVDCVKDLQGSNADGIILLDLPNIKQSAIKTISDVREICSDGCKLIAIHIYTTKLLIDPLFDAGVDGYLTYEPSLQNIKDAVSTVDKGEVYLPGQIY